jgi:hypothetical protein
MTSYTWKDLEYVVQTNNLKKFKYWIKTEADFDEYTSSQIFSLAIRSDSIEIAKYIFDLDPEVTCNNFTFLTAARSGYTDMIKFLVSNGFDPQGPPGNEVLFSSICFGHLEILEYLLSVGCSLKNMSDVFTKKYRDGNLMEKCGFKSGYAEDGNFALIDCIKISQTKIAILLINLTLDPILDFDFLQATLKLSFHQKNYEVYHHILFILPKRYTFFLIKENLSDTYAEIAYKQSIRSKFGQIASLKNILFKNIFLKKVLKPTSLYVQLFFI